MSKSILITLLYCCFTLVAFADGSVTNRLVAFDFNKKLGRGVNLGNALDAPEEGAWGVTLEAEYFELIAQQGFSNVRIPIRWSAINRAADNSPYEINETFFQRVDWAIDNAIKNKLFPIINIHHYNELFEAPEEHKARFIAIWEQISARYQNKSDSLVFEILNEPHGNLLPSMWNQYFREALSRIRVTNPERMVIIGSAEYGGISGLSALDIPDTDSNLIATVHYYSPFHFTHQGAEWVDGADDWKDIRWNNFEHEQNAIRSDFDIIKSFSERNNIPIYMGEFGAYSKADETSRALWTTVCARLMEEYGFSWAYWEFCSGFGIYDSEYKTFRTKLVDALLSNPLPEAANANLETIYEWPMNQGYSPWFLNIFSTASAFLFSQEGFVSILVSTKGTESWHIQFYNQNIKIEKGRTYVVSFDAKADIHFPINAYIGIDHDPWTSYSGNNNYTLSTEWQTFVQSFTMTAETDLAARMVFDLSNEIGTINLRNIKIEAIAANGSHERIASATQLYPSPAKTSINFRTASMKPSKKHIQIFNRAGKLMHEETTFQPQGKINVSSLPGGLYLFQINNESAQKFIKQ